MSGEQRDGLPESLETWVENHAATTDAEPEDVVARAVTLYRLVEDHAESADGVPGDVDDLVETVEEFDQRIDALDQQLGGLNDQVGRLNGRVATVERDLDTKIDDVRQRVIQVKQEADAKAPADHDHPDLRQRVDAAETTAARGERQVEDLRDDVDSGFENFEEILTHLTDEAETFDDKLTRLAQVVVDLRRRTEAVEQHLARQDALEDLKRTANKQGDTRAQCADCSRPVDIGLLTEPRCPHCDAGFVDVEPSGRFFGSATLQTGHPPALVAGDEPTTTDEDDTSAADLLEESKNA